jgi:DNA-binding transcriptional MerR regulator
MILDKFTSSTAVKVIGATYRQIDYWTNAGLITPSIDQGRRGKVGGYTRRYWSLQDLVGMRAIITLRNAGISLQALRKVAQFIQELGGSFSNTYLIASGDDVFIRHSDDLLISALKRPGQQTMAIIFDLGTAENEVKAAIEKLAA